LPASSQRHPGEGRDPDTLQRVRAEDYLWFQLSEQTSDTYMMIQQRKNAL